MSPGRLASPPGMFSQVGTTPTTFILRPRAITALRVPNTLAAPHISNFISSMAAAGLMEMPPVSKVMPLPTNTRGFWPLGPP